MSNQKSLYCGRVNNAAITAMYDRDRREVFILVCDDDSGRMTSMNFDPSEALFADHAGVTMQNLNSQCERGEPYKGLDPLIFNHIVTEGLKVHGENQARPTFASQFILASSCVHE